MSLLVSKTLPQQELDHFVLADVWCSNAYWCDTSFWCGGIVGIDLDSQPLTPITDLDGTVITPLTNSIPASSLNERSF